MSILQLSPAGHLWLAYAALVIAAAVEWPG
jgi:hypothetical protein